MDYRDAVWEEMRKQLVGPVNGPNEFVVGQPIWRYMAGMLFPREFVDLAEDDLEDQPIPQPSSDEIVDSDVARAYDLLPASMGISFYIKGSKKIICRVHGARYQRVGLEDLFVIEKDPLAVPDEAGSARVVLESLGGTEDHSKAEKALGSSRIWKRIPLNKDPEGDYLEFTLPHRDRPHQSSKATLNGKAEVSSIIRKSGDGWIVTVTLVNAAQPDGIKGDEQIEAMLFQAGFSVSTPEGKISAYPSVNRMSSHEEDQELALCYRNRKTFAIGHGCSPTWKTHDSEEHVTEIVADPMPKFEVRGMTNDIELEEPAAKALDINWLAEGKESPEEIKQTLDAFVDAYEFWVKEQKKDSESLPGTFSGVVRRILERQENAVSRMRKGIDCLLCGKPETFKAFRLAQSAMSQQFAWNANRKGGPFAVGSGKTGPIDFCGQSPKWYPFQLGFQLLVIESLANPDSEDRDLVDLLWFPTGGGKTEAYLALAAFEMILRRLRDDDSSTAVIMRYTLRLLTSQQFERAATIVAVLESMRRSAPDLLGMVPFRLGLWAGGQLTPNRLDNDNERDPGAVQIIDQILNAEIPENPFLLRSCPRCGTRLIPSRISGTRSHYGVWADASSFRMSCPDTSCEMHEGIPVSVVDQDLYVTPPTFLIGTVDKFARMVWVPESRVFLGRKGVQSHSPSLIIQDELHLINGPLGSIAGGYEAGMDTAISFGRERPKYLASTATIQRAKEQCKALYGRDSFVFPPSGMDAEDAYFSKEDTDSPGRTYVGVMGHGKYSSLTSLIQVSAAAAIGPTVIPEKELVARDSYWTQVIYHNSRQELGKTTTMLRDDVRTRLKILDPKRSLERNIEAVEELSANLKGGAVAEVLERLSVGYPQPDCIDVVACTNMISVGVDVGRLGLMIIKGQPKATAEYIQASSRVGRDRKRPSGIVITVYSPLRPRDRSQFEGFQAYHQALYRAVEPSSVTPFSPPARTRTLHAGLVLVMRHVMEWEESRDACAFDPSDRNQAKIIEEFEKRILQAARPDEAEETRKHLHDLIEEWFQEARNTGRGHLTFNSGKQFVNLLTQYPMDVSWPGFWPTLNSMRHVDGETPFAVKGQS